MYNRKSSSRAGGPVLPPNGTSWGWSNVVSAVPVFSSSRKIQIFHGNNVNIVTVPGLTEWYPMTFNLTSAITTSQITLASDAFVELNLRTDPNEKLSVDVSTL
jgi:hypothetical protein